MSKEKRLKWQREKLATDKDYRENQKAAQKAWIKRNPGYSKKYRENHPEYVEKNRKDQRARNKKQKIHKELPDFVKSEIAKMDVLKPKKVIISGYYKLIPLYPEKIAKMDELIVKIDIISKS